MDKECRRCLYFDLCGSPDVCDHYAPPDDEYSDDDIEGIIEEGRIVFRQEWFRYLEENEV